MPGRAAASRRCADLFEKNAEVPEKSSPAQDPWTLSDPWAPGNGSLVESDACGSDGARLLRAALTPAVEPSQVLPSSQPTRGGALSSSLPSRGASSGVPSFPLPQPVRCDAEAGSAEACCQTDEGGFSVDGCCPPWLSSTLVAQQDAIRSLI